MICSLTSSGFIKAGGCPPNPSRIRSVVFRNNNLDVVYGPNVEIQIPLGDFFVPVENATNLDFQLPAKGSTYVPFDIYKLYSSNYIEFFKFMALFAKYCSDTPSKEQFIEWTTIDAIEKGELLTTDPIGASTDISFDHLQVTSLAFPTGFENNYFDSNNIQGPIYAATLGGLITFNNGEMSLRNSLNSHLPTDFLYSVALTNYGTYSGPALWLASNEGLLSYDPPSNTLIKQFTVANSSILSNAVNDVVVLSGTNYIATATNAGVSIWNTVSLTWSNYTQYNTPAYSNSNALFLEYDSATTTLMIGSTSGLFNFDMTNNTWDLWNSSNLGWGTAPDSIICAFRQTVGATSFSILGTTGGALIIINGSYQTTLTTADGLLDNTVTAVSGIHGDNISKYVFGHPNGASFLTLGPTGPVSIFTIGVAGGILTAEAIPDPNMGLTASGSVYFGSSNGILTRTI